MSIITKNDGCGGEFKACPTTKFTWRIENYSKMNVGTTKLLSEPFMFEGFKWRMFSYPEATHGYFSIFMQVVEEATTPIGWFADAFIIFTVIDQLNPKESLSIKTKHTFQSGCPDWGFGPFTSREILHDKRRGFLLNDSCVIEAELTLAAATAISVINVPPAGVDPIRIDYLLHLETMDSIFNKAQLFLKSTKDHKGADEMSVKLLEEAVKTEKGIKAKLSMWRKRHTKELESATKEAKELIELSFSSVTDEINAARSALINDASLCSDFDRCVSIHEGAIKNAADGNTNVRAKLDELRRRRRNELEAARKEAKVLTEERVEASRRTHRLFELVTKEQIDENSNELEVSFPRLQLEASDTNNELVCVPSVKII